MPQGPAGLRRDRCQGHLPELHQHPSNSCAVDGEWPQMPALEITRAAALKAENGIGVQADAERPRGRQPWNHGQSHDH